MFFPVRSTSAWKTRDFKSVFNQSKISNYDFASSLFFIDFNFGAFVIVPA